MQWGHKEMATSANENGGGGPKEITLDSGSGRYDETVEECSSLELEDAPRYGGLKAHSI